MLICTTTGRVISAGDRMRVLTPVGFTEGELDGVTLDGRVSVRAGERHLHVYLDEIEAVSAPPLVRPAPAPGASTPPPPRRSRRRA